LSIISPSSIFFFTLTFTTKLPVPPDITWVTQ
jgi:hypothetical protein